MSCIATGVKRGPGAVLKYTHGFKKYTGASYSATKFRNGASNID